MTLLVADAPGALAPPPAAPAAVRPRRGDIGDWAAFTTLAAALLWVLGRSAGRDIGALPVLLLVVLVATLALRPWRFCPVLVAAVALAPGAIAVGLGSLTVYGDGGLVSDARWVVLGLTTVAATSFGRTAGRRAALVVLVLLLVLQAFSTAWLPWWGYGDPAAAMTGSFHSANPFGGAMLAGAAVGAGLCVLGRQRVQWLGFGLGSVCAAGVWFSGSRAAVLLAASALVVFVLTALPTRGLRAAASGVLMTAGSVAVVLLLSSGIWFPGTTGGSAATAKSDNGMTMASTGSERLNYWNAAWQEFREFPVLGAGNGSFGGYSRQFMPVGSQRSPYVHNEPLGALAEGGLPRGVAVLVLYVVVGGAVAREAYAVFCRRRAEPAVLAAGLAAGCVLTHSLVDFALIYPFLLACLGLLLGVVLRASPLGATAARPALVGAACCLVGVAGIYVAVSHDRVGGADRPGSVADAYDYADRPGEMLPGVTDARAAAKRLELLAAAPPAVTARERAAARRVLAQTTAQGRLDDAVEANRVRVLQRLGDDAAALSAAQTLALRNRSTAPFLLLPLAEVLAGAGNIGLAADLLAYEAWEGLPDNPAQYVALIAAAERMASARTPGPACAASRLPAEWRPRVPAGITTAPGGQDCAGWAVGARLAFEEAT